LLLLVPGLWQGLLQSLLRGSRVVRDVTLGQGQNGDAEICVNAHLNPTYDIDEVTRQ